jgi:hypothetical protein
VSNLADRDPLGYAAVAFLRTLDELQPPGPAVEYVSLEQLREVASENDESWPVRMLDRLRWERQVIDRLNRGAIEYGNRSFERPLGELLDELSEEAADVGGWAAIAHHALRSRGMNLEGDERELIARALRDAALAGAQAWARIDQARALLAATKRRIVMSARGDRIIRELGGAE